MTKSTAYCRSTYPTLIFVFDKNPESYLNYYKVGTFPFKHVGDS